MAERQHGQHPRYLSCPPPLSWNFCGQISTLTLLLLDWGVPCSWPVSAKWSPILFYYHACGWFLAADGGFVPITTMNAQWGIARSHTPQQGRLAWASVTSMGESMGESVAAALVGPAGYPQSTSRTPEVQGDHVSGVRILAGSCVSRRGLVRGTAPNSTNTTSGRATGHEARSSARTHYPIDTILVRCDAPTQTLMNKSYKRLGWMPCHRPGEGFFRPALCMVMHNARR